ncbi:MAG: TIGR03667 family PPOX class F420-dependent oxidoreductase [Acidimicrobiia bacterium]
MGIRQGSRTDPRLETELIIWLTTVRGDGQPQASPVWFLWDGESFLIYSQPHRQKLRNIDRNPHVALNLDGDGGGGDIVTMEGTARVAEEAPAAHQVPEYLEKYREEIARLGTDPEGFAADYSVAIEVRPTRVRAF